MLSQCNAVQGLSHLTCIRQTKFPDIYTLPNDIVKLFTNVLSAKLHHKCNIHVRLISLFNFNRHTKLSVRNNTRTLPCTV